MSSGLEAGLSPSEPEAAPMVCSSADDALSSLMPFSSQPLEQFFPMVLCACPPSAACTCVRLANASRGGAFLESEICDDNDDDNDDDDDDGADDGGVGGDVKDDADKRTGL